MVARDIKGRYFIALFFTIAIFVIGILIGSLVTSYKISNIYNSERDLMTQFLTQSLQNDLLLDNPCEFSNSGLISTDLFNVERRLESLEREKGNKNEDVIGLKRYYTALQIKDYLYFKKVKDECNGDFILNLYFYSNDVEKCDLCSDQGVVLTYARGKNKNLRTYSFDTDLDSPLIRYMVKFYNITSVPSVVFDEKVYREFLDRDGVMEIVA